jgi:exodeoxyribonuclease-3
MRIVAWNCNMALERKAEVLLELRPDIAIISECAEPERLRLRSKSAWLEGEPVWVGRNPHKGLAVLAFNGYAARLADPYHATLRYIAPVHVTGPTTCNLLAVWAQNASTGGIRKHQLGPLRRALTRYKGFLGERPAIVAGDLNSNTIWDKPGWRINHATKVRILKERFGLVSAYHAIRGEAHGNESEPTLYWRDRTKDGPTYHIDYVFLPLPWISQVRELTVGGFEPWCGAGLSDHVPVVVDVDL